MLVLNFHRIERLTGVEITRVSPARFSRMLQMLAASGLEIAEAGYDPLSPRAQVALTFDDGFASVAENALPVVCGHGWTAIVFLIAAAVGKADDWDVRVLGRRRPMMNWAQAQEWSRAGIEFGSHSLTHADLTARSPRALKRELADSRSLIADRLGMPVRYLAYPFGRHDAHVRAAAQEAGYEAAFAVGRDRIATDDRFAIPRVNVHALTSLFGFRSLLAADALACRETSRAGLRPAPTRERPGQVVGTDLEPARQHHWWGERRTRLFTSLSAGSAVVSNWRRRRRHPAL